MPRTVLPVTRPTRDGVAAPTEQAGDTANGHVVANTSRTIIGVHNADSVSHQATFGTPGTVDGLAIADRVATIPPSSTQYFSGFQTSIYGSQMTIDVDSTQLKLTAFEA